MANKSSIKKKVKKIAYWGGLLVIFGTHVWMLFKGLPTDSITMHVVMNLAAGGAIIYSNVE